MSDDGSGEVDAGKTAVDPTPDDVDTVLDDADADMESRDVATGTAVGDADKVELSRDKIASAELDGEGLNIKITRIQLLLHVYKTKNILLTFDLTMEVPLLLHAAFVRS